MGRPRLIIVIRHGQSEGNRNRAIHQTVPDHRVKLTPEGWAQADDAGKRLRALLRPDDTLQFYTSPYRRTRETTEGILRSLTADDDPETGPSPFPRHTIRVYEEPRLREQDFGNFQPCSAAMERMWQERADYGHFFYRIPNGESAADAYDRVSGFNETLWRSFQDPDFPSVCVLVTHGLMTRVFLTRWYHFTVEYFEDLRNVRHCEFIVMKRHEDSGKYVLQNQLRTWSELKRAADEERRAKGLPPEPEPEPAAVTSTGEPAAKQWGGCPEGCTHEHDHYPLRERRKTTAGQSLETSHSSHGATQPSTSTTTTQPEPDTHPSPKATPADLLFRAEEDSEAFPLDHGSQSHPIRESYHAWDASAEGPNVSSVNVPNVAERGTDNDATPLASLFFKPAGPHWLRSGRDFGGSESGAPTPAAGVGGESADYGFPTSTSKSPRSLHARVLSSGSNSGGGGVVLGPGEGGSGSRAGPHSQTNDRRGERESERENENEQPSEAQRAEWVAQSGVGTQTRVADRLDTGGVDDDDSSDGTGGLAAAEKRDRSLRGSVY